MPGRLSAGISRIIKCLPERGGIDTMPTTNSKRLDGSETSAVKPSSALTPEDVKNIITQAQVSVADPVTLGLQIFDSLGDNITLSGEILRKALTDSSIAADGLLAPLIAAAQIITKIGGQLTVTNNEEIKIEIGGTPIKFKSMVKFDVAREGGLPTVSNIQGVAAHKVFWFDITQIELRENQGKRILHIETSGGARDFPLL
jgi:hypothetical protein